MTINGIQKEQNGLTEKPKGKKTKTLTQSRTPLSRREGLANSQEQGGLANSQEKLQ